MEEGERSRSADRWRANRGISMPTAAIIMVIVLAVVGAGGYFAFNSVKPQKSTPPATCSPVTSPRCTQVSGTHDVTLFAPFRAAQAGTLIPFTATLPNGQVASSFTFTFGDGATVTQTSPTATHKYVGPGTYIVSVQATVGTVTHDNYLKLIVFSVTAAYTSLASLNAAPVIGQVVANSSQVTGVPPTAIITPGGSVTVNGSYNGQPTNPLFSLATPTIISTGGTVGATTSTATSAHAQVSFASPGIDTITFVGKAVEMTGSTVVATAYLNYTWTVFVASANFHASQAAGATARSPHPGVIQFYELNPGGAKTVDPALAYDTASGELVFNMFQTLVSYNGTQAGPDPTDFTPTLAACVPGSDQCKTLFGNTLFNSTSSGFTFVLSAAPQFYDPGAPSAKWGVYPSDVLYTLWRTELFSNLPFVGSSPGWIVTQALLELGNGTWDNGLHSLFNNTPKEMARYVTVNASGTCPAIAMSSPNYHGCITFNAVAEGIAWPFFLELVADWSGMGIESCGWYSAGAQGNALPGWTDAAANQGDHPCKLPGGATSTDDVAYKSAISAMSPTIWDNYEQKGSLPPYLGNVRYAGVGTGPYYLASITVGSTYTLKANPNYAVNPLCTWTGCYPKPGGFANTVTVTWEATSTPGEQAYAAGAADHSGIPSTEASVLLQYIQQGKVQAMTFPTISIYGWFFNFNFNLAGAQRLTTNPITVPSDFFSHIAVREFIVHSYPYDTAQQTVNTVQGIQYDFPYGGAIPQYMGNYYPKNISWPSGNPSADPNTVGTAAWWWKQGTTVGSPYYDSEMAACTSANPCQVPFIGESGAPQVDQLVSLLVNGVTTYSGGALKLNPLDINFVNLVINAEQPAGQNPNPFYQLGWAPDYPDPTDYVLPFYGEYNVYTSPDSVAQTLYGTPAYNLGAYPGGHCVGTAATINVSDVLAYVHMAQTLGGIPEACQGSAYHVLNWEDNLASVMPPGPARVLAYNLVEQIANGLVFYLYWGQSNVVTSVAPWIDPTTVVGNIMILGGSMWPFFQLGGNGVIS